MVAARIERTFIKYFMLKRFIFFLVETQVNELKGGAGKTFLKLIVTCTRIRGVLRCWSIQSIYN